MRTTTAIQSTTKQLPRPRAQYLHCQTNKRVNNMTRQYVSKSNAKLLTTLEDNARHHYQIAARRRRNCENLPSWFTCNTAAYYDGMLAATYGAIEATLHVANAYHGFSESHPNDQLGKPIAGDANGNGLRNYFFNTKPT